MLCPICGAQIVDGTTFCPVCGGGLRGTVRPEQTVPTAPAPFHIAPAAPRKKSPAPVILAIVLAVLLMGVGTAGITYYLGFWSLSVGQANAALPTFGSSKPLRLLRATKIVPSEAQDTPYTHYYVRLRNAETSKGKSIHILNFPRLEVRAADGFCMGDFADDLPAGNYCVVVTTEDGADRVLPPVVVDDAADKSDAGADSDAAEEDPVVIVPQDKGGVDNGSAGSAGSSSGASAAAPVKQGRYAAFLKVLQDIVAEHGDPAVEVKSYGRGADQYIGRGLCFAQLVDFGDGVERLVTARHDPDAAGKILEGRDYVIEVWEYDEASDAAERVASAVESNGQDLVRWLTLIKNSDGKAYLEWCHVPDDSAYAYYGLAEDGSFGRVLSATIEYERGDQGPTGVVTYTVNGKAVDEDTFLKAMRRYDQSFWSTDADATSEIWVLQGYDGLTRFEHSNPSWAVQTAIDLITKLTCVTTNSDDAPTKVISGSEVDSARRAEELMMQNVVLGCGYAASANGYDYYWDGELKGLVRAEPNSGDVDLIVPQDGNNGDIYHICADGDYVFYVEGDYLEYCWRICRVNSDGSDRRVLFDSGKEGLSRKTDVFSMGVYGHRLYVVMGTSQRDRVIGMDEDGGNRAVEIEFADSEGGATGLACALWLGPDGVYYTVTNDDALWYRKYGASSGKRIIGEPSGDMRFGSVVQHEGRLICTLGDSTGQKNQLWSFALDGSDAKKLLDAPEARNFGLLGLADGRAYYCRWVMDSRARRWRAESVVGLPFVDGVQEVELEVEGEFVYPYLGNSGERFVILEESVDRISFAGAARSVSYDGKDTTVYLER